MLYSRIVKRIPYLELRLIIAVIVSIVMVFADNKFHMFSSFKNCIANYIYLFYYLCDKPNYIFNYVAKVLVTYKELIAENDALRKELFLKNSELLLMDQYKHENLKLYELLNSPVYQEKRKLITKIIFIHVEPNNQQAIINQGKNKNIYVGQPVFAASGVIGQVISVNDFNSRVLLISDFEHALSVQLNRNDANNVYLILMGRGFNLDLYAEYSGNSTDICINDILITSGLDGRFPAGCPVAKISHIEVNSEQDYTIVRAKPIVNLKYLRYAMLILE
ncbi:rod shape-determining protein MreC [Candidatus Blochmanniella vafra str. BVAF]|uniref:Cell shape-determining protein MreC n=1 Tax=Blochmanniella vafra (strain BVAF) TaxID=859654 RepID=E8Q6U9_BLOVB|nr:rod shape-determining protein MreC [Candidatus Blochmannia vafer]ADV33696.1 rod shape-determining protein MreC [Candidatus Blochmannia vafer str. BVAF]